MKKLIAVAVLALLSSAAHAEVHELKFGGRSARIEIPTGCKKISCIRVNETTNSRRSGKPAYQPEEEQQETYQQTEQQPTSRRRQPSYQQQPQQQADEPQQAYAAPQANPVEQPAPQVQAPAPRPARAGAIAPGMAPGMAPGFAPAPAASQVEAQPEPQAQQQADDRISTARLSLPIPAPVAQAPAPVAQAAPLMQQAPAQVEQQQADEDPSPVGLWLTQKKEAKIRVVECGNNICGHVEGKPGDKVLINMKQTANDRWNGTVHDIRRGGNYSANIQLKSPDTLKVTGCAFGGMFCGGETWTRLQ